MSIRVRLSFDELVPGYSKKTWFLFDTTSCRLVADLEHLIQRKFDLQRNSAVNLYTEGFLLPAQEKIELIRDGDIIRVEQQGNVYKSSGKRKLDKKNKDSRAKKQKLNGEPLNGVNTQEKTHKKMWSSPSSSSESFDSYWGPLAWAALGDSESSSKSTTSSSIEKKLIGQAIKSVRNNVKGVKAGNSLKGNMGRNTALKINPANMVSRSSSSRSSSSTSSSSTSSSSTSSSSTPSFESSSSSSEDSMNDAHNEIIASPKTLNFSSSSSASSSSLLSSSSSSSEDSSDGSKGVSSARTKERSVNKGNKSIAGNSKSRDLSTEIQNETARQQSSTQNQPSTDDLNAKTKEKFLHKNNKSKAKNNSSTASLPAERQINTSRSQSEASEQAAQCNQMANGNRLQVTGKRNKTNSELPRSNNNNSHIRFDSDGESEEISAPTSANDGKNEYNTLANNTNTREVLNNTQENQENQHFAAFSEQRRTIDGSSLNNGVVNGSGNERMGMNIGNDTGVKNTSVDYSTFQSLCGPPRVGDRIAYKVLELSASYTPEMSDYKEGVVLGYNPVVNEVLLELTNESLSKPLGDGNISTKFELISEDEEDEEPKPPVILDRKVSVPWTSMVDPRLIR